MQRTFPDHRGPTGKLSGISLADIPPEAHSLGLAARLCLLLLGAVDSGGGRNEPDARLDHPSYDLRLSILIGSILSAGSKPKILE